MMISEPVSYRRGILRHRAAPQVFDRRRLLTYGSVFVALSGVVVQAADPNPNVGKRTDWAAIDDLLAAGDYANVVAAVTNELAKGEKPKSWAADFLPRSIEWIRLLMRRGAAELRLGRLDAASATLEEAYRTFTDDDFKRQLGNELRNGNPRTLTTVVLLDADLVELLYLRIAVLLERMRFMNLGIDASSTTEAGESSERMSGWSDEIDSLERVAAKARKTLAERLKQGDPASLGSPYLQSLAGRFRPALVAGLKSLELGLFEVGASRTQGKPESAAASAKVGEATGPFDEAAEALNAAFEAAAPKGIDTMKRDARIEANLLQADLLTCAGRALMASGEPSAARERFAKVIELRKEVAAFRRVKQPEKHADLFVPLLLSAESLLDEAQMALQSGDESRSRDWIVEASKVLDRADSLAFPPEHPLRAWQLSLRERDTADLATVKSTIPGNDVADAAARRVRQAVDGTTAVGATRAP